MFLSTRLFSTRVFASALGLSLLLNSIPAFAASTTDATDLFVRDLSVDPYSIDLTYTIGNEGGEAGYSGFRSEAELGKVVKNSYTLYQGSTVLYTFNQEWRDANSNSSAYRYTDSSVTMTSEQFGNYVENLVQEGTSYSITFCADINNKVPESDETDNCTSASFTFSPDPDGDNDGDGLTNIEEGYLGTDENKADTDGDGLDDSVEIALTATDPTLYDTYAGDAYENDYDFDTDMDGDSNGDEVNDWAPVGTPGNFTGEGANPLNFDTDEDGLGDKFEVDYTNYSEEIYCPLDVTIADGDHDGQLDIYEDCDFDGLTNLDEYNLGTSPIEVDTDGDSFSDLDEVVEGTDPIDAASFPVVTPEEPVTDPNADNDGDGLTNGEEEALGTDMNSADSDGDFYTDFEELSVGTDPLSINSVPYANFDTDSDGKRDLFDWDDDGDRLLDTYETSNGTSPRDSDTDDDGVNDKNDLYPLDASRSA